MTLAVVTTLITAFGSLTVVGVTYWFTKKREREAEWRKEKLAHYKNFVTSLSGAIAGETTAEGQRAFSRACNDLMLVAPQSVIEALYVFREEIRTSNPHKSVERHDELMAKLLFEMRRDLQILPKDDLEKFKVKIWAAGVESND